MKNLFGFIALVLFLVSCDSRPRVVYAPVGTAPIVQPLVAEPIAQPVVAQPDYQVIQDPYTGARQVIYTMNGLQYVIAYATFMNWYHYGGYGYVNSMYSSHRNYFNSYSSNRYRGWKSSTFRNTYNGPSRTQSRPSTSVRPSAYTNSSNRNTSSSFGKPTISRPTSSSSSFGSRSSSSSYSRPSSSFGGSSSRSSSSSFGGRSGRR